VALPSYIDYVQRSRVPVALDALSSYATRMEQRFQDTGSYASDGSCAASLPTAANFALSCSITNSGQGFSAVATGSGNMTGYSYSIDQMSNRVTLYHPKGVPAVHCWSMRGLTCDT
jgi:type IV pilus assembly protein PilE